MQVAESRTRLQEAVKERYLESDAYLGLKSGRQRDSSVEVLDFIASHGLDPVRRRDIRRAFMAGGMDRHRTKKSIKGLTDHELQRILDRLTSIPYRYLEKQEVVPPSARGKDRSKPDVYYALSQTKVRREDLTNLRDIERYDHIEKAILANLGSRRQLIYMARLELASYDWLNMSDEAIEQQLKIFGYFFHETNDKDVVRWAEDLPEDETSLKEQINNYIDRKAKT